MYVYYIYIDIYIHIHIYIYIHMHISIQVRLCKRWANRQLLAAVPAGGTSCVYHGNVAGRASGVPQVSSVYMYENT